MIVGRVIAEVNVHGMDRVRRGRVVIESAYRGT